MKNLDDMAQALTDENNGKGTATATDAGRLSHRKIMLRLMAPSAGQPDSDLPPDKAAALTAERMATMALGRAAENLYGLATYPEAVRIGPISLSEMPELLPELALLAVVEGRGDTLGVVALCPGMVASLIEMQVIGRISSREVRQRKPTRTDAAISADFVGALLRELARQPASGPALPDFGSFSYASFLDDPRPLMLMLDEGPHIQISLRFRMGAAGQRDGQVMVVLPTPRSQPGPDGPQTEARLLGRVMTDSGTSPPQSPGPSASSGMDLATAVQDVGLNLVGILSRKVVSLAALKALRKGSLITLPAHTLDMARLESVRGQLLAQGRFGESHGYHAIRLRPQTTAMQDMSVPETTATIPKPAIHDIDLTQPDAFRSGSDDSAPAGQSHG